MDGLHMKIFIVDDEAAVVEWLQKNIDWEEYEAELVGASTCVRDVIAYCEHDRLDILITDISMPEMSGLELIRTLKEKNRDLLTIIVSAYDKFEYVKEAISHGVVNYLLKPINAQELSDCLRAALSIYNERKKRLYYGIAAFRNTILRELLSGSAIPLDFEKRCELAGLRFHGERYQVALVRLHTADSAEYQKMLDFFFSSELNDVCYMLLDECMNLAIIASGSEQSIQKIFSRVERIARCLDDCTLCIGFPVSSYETLCTSYQGCRDFLDSGVFSSPQTIDLTALPYSKYLEPHKSRVLRVAQTHVREKQYPLLAQLLQEYFSSWRSEPTRQKEMLCMLVFLMKNMRQNASACEPSACFCAPLCADADSETLLSWAQTYLENFQVASVSAGLHPHVAYALRMIEARYMDSTLSLKTVSDACHVSPAYLGKLFHTQTGEYFNDYMTRIRIQRAEVMLCADGRIGDIARKAGFSNQSYFGKMFRRMNGVSPAEYRRQVRREESSPLEE